MDRKRIAMHAWLSDSQAVKPGVRKVEAEIELWKVQQDYADNHPDVRRAKKKVEIYEKAIKEILG